MPRGDGTGPEGKGPRTGRGRGGCPPDPSAPKDEERPLLRRLKGGRRR